MSDLERYAGGRDNVLGRKIVLCRVSGPHAARLNDEARAAAAVSHPNIVSILDLGEGWIVFEWTEGSTIRERLAHGPISAAEVAKMATELGGALAAIHEAGLVHGDVRPENVLLTKTGAKLAAFGLPSEREERAAAADQRAFASTLYEAFSGRPAPAEGAPTPLAQLADDIRARVLRARVDAALSRAFGKNPYPSCRELGTMVSGAIDPPYSGAFPTLRAAELEAFSHSTSIVPKPTRRIQNVLAGLAVILIALLIVFGRRRPDHSEQPVPSAKPAAWDAGGDAR